MELLGVKIDTIRLEAARESLNEPQIIFTPNPEIILEAQKNPDFKKALQTGSLNLADGNGLLLVSTLLRSKSKIIRALLFLPAYLLFLFWKFPFKGVIPQIIHGSDFMNDVIEWSVKNNKAVFFLGGREDVAKKTAEYFKKRWGGLKVAGFSNEDPGENAFLEVKRSGAEVLFVAYGAPKQELWIQQYTPQLPQLFHAMGVGGSFDFWSGAVKRAPRFMQKMGIEWLWRLFLNPSQRLKRIWKATVVFPLLTIFGKNL